MEMYINDALSENTCYLVPCESYNKLAESQATYLCDILEHSSSVTDCLEKNFRQLRSYHDVGL